MHILVKFPTRGRPKIFLERLKEYANGALKPDKISFLVSYDADDFTMNQDVVAAAMKIHPDVTMVRGYSKTKIEAVNADIANYGKPWDIILVVSDDMFLRKQGWDEVIREDYAKHYPDLDGSMWYFDGAQEKICTLACMGRTLFNRFGYVYNPNYSSFFCDDEATAVFRAMGKLTFSRTVIAGHYHPAWLKGMPVDDTYRRNNKFWKSDQATYEQRKQLGFPA